MSQKNDLPTTEETIPAKPQSPGFGTTDFKAIGVVGPDHHAVEEVGSSVMEKKGGEEIAELVSEVIYENSWAFYREWLQNHESACIRRAKHIIKESDEYPEGWLTHTFWVDAETGETVIDYDDDQQALAQFAEKDQSVNQVEVPRPIREVLQAAKTLGYDPTIVFDIHQDEREIITSDNGDGMTPTEFDEHFNDITGSKSQYDSETGGNIGIGSESAAMVHGKHGQMLIATRSIYPKNGRPRNGFIGTSELGGANFVPGEVEDDFFGTEFQIPVKNDFNLGKAKSHTEKFVDKLRVPLLYREHNAGSTPIEEEYEASYFVEDYGNPPIVIERPGEFSVVAGPDVIDTSYNADDEDTFLVSFPIDRNTSTSINTFWEVVVQIHDEQGRIVAGPNRGRFKDDVNELHEDDVVTPQPTADRDRLQRDEDNKGFFNYIEDLVKTEEMERVAEIAERMKEADHPGIAIEGEPDDWALFKKMVDYHGSYHVTDKKRRFESFITDQDELPDFDDDEVDELWALFKDVQYCHHGAGRSTKKSSRREKSLGWILSNINPERVYMAASTGGNFTQRFRVIENTYPAATVIVVNGARKYDEWGQLFGFKVLKKVPLTDTEDDDHEYNVPDKIHEDNINKGSDYGKPQELKDRALKLRTDSDNTSIDLRLTIEDAQERLKSEGKFGGHNKLVLFPRTSDENISDHYKFSKYAAIASVSKAEYEKLAGYDNVMTYEEYTKWSKSAQIYTEDGVMTPSELIEDDRLVVLAYRAKETKQDVARLLTDEYEELRQLYCEDIRDQIDWTNFLDGYDGSYGGDSKSDVDDADKPETLFAMAGEKTLRRADWAFNQLEFNGPLSVDMLGLKLSRYKYKRHNPCRWKSLDKKTTTYRLMVDTPNWDNNSDIYRIMPSNRNKMKAQVYLGLHDRGIDPTKRYPPELRGLVSGEQDR